MYLDIIYIHLFTDTSFDIYLYVFADIDMEIIYVSAVLVIYGTAPEPVCGGGVGRNGTSSIATNSSTTGNTSTTMMTPRGVCGDRGHIMLEGTGTCKVHKDIFFMKWSMIYYMGVSKNRGTPKWMVYFMENPIKHGMIWGVKTTYFWFNTHMMFHYNDI